MYLNLFVFSGCCWVVLQSQGPKSLSNWFCLSFISTVSFLLTFVSTSRNFSWVKDLVLKGRPSRSVVRRIHGAQTAPAPQGLPQFTCTHRLTDWLHHTFQERVLVGYSEISCYQVCHHLIVFLCFLLQSCRHHAGLPAELACFNPLTLQG